MHGKGKQVSVGVGDLAMMEEPFRLQHCVSRPLEQIRPGLGGLHGRASHEPRHHHGRTIGAAGVAGVPRMRRLMVHWLGIKPGDQGRNMFGNGKKIG